MPTLINTHEAFRQLRKEGGFSKKQADAIVGAFGDPDKEVATQSDVERLEEQIEGVEERLTQRIEGVENRRTQRLDEVEKRLDGRIEEVEERLDERLDEVEKHLTQRIEGVDGRIDGVEKRLDGRIDGLEKHLTRRIEQEGADVRSDLKGFILATGGVICAFLAVAVSLLIYLVG
jgi:DNA anti-recombination protein RmuC